MDITDGNTIEDLWTPFKELLAVVEGYLNKESGLAPYAVHTFESVLRRHKQTFLSILKNPVKNPASREEIRKGVTEGVNLPSIGRTFISKELIDEAIIISDMYNVNEYQCLELLHTAARQAPRHPGLARGLLAVLLLADGRRAAAHALRQLVTARDGVAWSISAREEIVTYVTRYVDQLVADGLLGNVLDALSRFTLASELELLQNNRALPPGMHYSRLVNSIEETRKLLAGVIFAASAQRGLSKDIILRILAEQSASPSLGPTGALDETSLALQMALLYALDLSVLHAREDGEELSRKLPLMQDPELISALVAELCPPAGQPDPPEKVSGPRALCQLSLGLALSALRRAPAAPRARPAPAALDCDEALVDAALDNKVFEYIDTALLSPLVAQEEFYQRRLHSLVTDFIVLMHSKLMEMRVKADEAARATQMYLAEGIAPPGGAGGSRGHLDALLRIVERLYERDPRGLRHCYWEAQDKTQANYRTGGRAATLYKFVRLSGSLVCPALLPAYLRALAGLAVPRHTWQLLARRDALSAHHLLSALQRYHANLRADPSPFSEHLHASSLGASAVVTPAARPGKLLVRQEEVEAMIAALKLIEAVAKQDEAASISICENLQWDAVNTMFGLICCQVPLQLKAALCHALGALGSHAATAPRVWAALEAGQLCAARDDRGLARELRETECRIEQYPLSLAFLSLLDSLCAAAPLPRALGAGSRTPGLEPYVEHVLARLALPAPARGYAIPQHKWQMLSACFRVLARWLRQYSPAAPDFAPAPAAPPPGRRVLMLLHNKSELLRLLFSTMDEAQDLLDVQPLGKNYIEECLVFALEMLERALVLERALIDAAGEAGQAVLIVPLSKLILAEEGNPHCDRLVRCCLLLQHGGNVARLSVALLAAALRPGAAPSHLLHCARAAPYAALVRHGFVECLEAEEWGEEEQVEIVRQTKEGVLSLLLQLLPLGAPNFAHFLLGYQTGDDISRSSLNEAGVAGYPRTCLHSILDILDKHIAQNNPEREASNLIEMCYRLVYWLCARPNTSAPALRFLRTRDYFLSRHVRAHVNLETASVISISARSWVLRAAACEGGAAGAGRQHAALAALLAALTQARHTQEWEWCLLRRALEALPVAVAAAPEPSWELFHAHQLRQAIAAVDTPTGLGGKRISVSRLHALLSRELATLHATAPQRNLVLLEIQKVLDYVTEVNRQRNLAATLTHYYDSWRQLTEIIFCVAPQDILSLEARKNLLLNILQDLLNKIPPAEVLPQIGNLASGTVLLLLVNLRHCYILQKRDTNLKSSEFETTFFGPSNQIMQTKSLTLKFILHKILSWILVSGSSTQKMRVNLYGALLNFLNIVNLKQSPAEPEEEVSATYVSRLDSSKAKPSKEESSLKSMVIDVISSFGDNLCSIVCGDCIGAGHDVCRMVALACLDTLLEINPRADWMSTLTNQGYLRNLIDSLLQDDEGLREALEPNPKSLRVIYVYESKMALINKIASTRVGAETVLSQGALSCLANMKVLSAHPDIHTGDAERPGGELLPPPATRFRQILVPALSLCDALLTALGTENHSCVIHVTHFLLSHLETVDVILRTAHPNSPEGLLLELEALTSVIARASNREVFGLVRADTALQPSAASLQRVRRLMLALLARCRVAPPPAPPRRATAYCKIVCNLLTYARHIAPPGGAPLPGSAGSAALALARWLRSHCAQLDKALATLLHTLRSELTAHDMKKLLPADSVASSPAEVRACVTSQLRADVRERQLQLRLCSHAGQLALYVVWVALRSQLSAAVGTDDSMNETSSWQKPSNEDDSVELRKELVNVLNDRFAEQLLETAKNQPQSSRDFIDIILKDIKAMLQHAPF